MSKYWKPVITVLPGGKTWNPRDGSTILSTDEDSSGRR